MDYGEELLREIEFSKFNNLMLEANFECDLFTQCQRLCRWTISIFTFNHLSTCEVKDTKSPLDISSQHQEVCAHDMLVIVENGMWRARTKEMHWNPFTCYGHFDGRNRNDFNTIESLDWESKGSIYFLSKYIMLKCLDGQISDSIAL